MAYQMARDQFGESDPASIFEAKGNFTGRAIIGDGGADTVMDRWIGETSSASRAFRLFIVERKRTTFAPGRIEEPDVRPAFGAKIGSVGRNISAGRTTFGQRIVKHWLRYFEHQPHRPLVG